MQEHSMRRLGEALWCLEKHLLLARCHIEETLQKLYRDRKMSGPTLEELAEAVKHLIAAEEHILEALEKSSDASPRLRELCDEIRRLRQDIANILFMDTVDDVHVRKLEDAASRLRTFFVEVRNMPAPKLQEQCSTCVEDLGKVIAEAEATVNALTSQACLVPKALASVGPVTLLAPDLETASRLQRLIEEDEKLRNMLNEAVKHGLRRIIVTCLAGNLRSLALDAEYEDGHEVLIHPEVLKLPDTHVKFVLAHELAHVLGADEEEANKIARDVSGIDIAEVRKMIDSVLKHAKTKSFNNRGKARNMSFWIKLLGAFAGKGVQVAGKYITVRLGKVGEKFYKRPDFWLDVGATIGSTLGYFKARGALEDFCEGMMLKVLPDTVVDYVMEAVSAMPKGMEYGEEYGEEYSEEYSEEAPPPPPPREESQSKSQPQTGEAAATSGPVIG